jgi:hypothetical protein
LFGTPSVQSMHWGKVPQKVRAALQSLLERCVTEHLDETDLELPGRFATFEPVITGLRALLPGQPTQERAPRSVLGALTAAAMENLFNVAASPTVAVPSSEASPKPQSPPRKTGKKVQDLATEPPPTNEPSAIPRQGEVLTLRVPIPEPDPQPRISLQWEPVGSPPPAELKWKPVASPPPVVLQWKPVPPSVKPKPAR